MNDWMKLIEQFEENGYKPQDIQRIVLFYEQTMANDKLLKEMYKKEKCDRI